MKKYKPSFAFMIRSRIKNKDFLFEFFFKNKKALDAGCGWGRFLKNDPLKITGLDSNKESVDSLTKQNLNAVLGNVDKMPFPDETFDAVHSRNVIEHLNVDEACGLIKESARVLKKGGLFILCSETVTKKFWGGFGHIKPYPPGAIAKLLREQNQEEFESIKNLEIEDVFYIGDYYKNKLLYFISALAGYYLPSLFAREYFLVLRKK